MTDDSAKKLTDSEKVASLIKIYQYLVKVIRNTMLKPADAEAEKSLHKCLAEGL